MSDFIFLGSKITADGDYSHEIKRQLAHWKKDYKKPRIDLFGLLLSERKVNFYFVEAIVISDGDCSHEIKRRLLLGRKAMTNLDSILKSRDITLPTKVRLVKAMVFPVVMYGCES